MWPVLGLNDNNNMQAWILSALHDNKPYRPGTSPNQGGYISYPYECPSQWSIPEVMNSLDYARFTPYPSSLTTLKNAVKPQKCIDKNKTLINKDFTPVEVFRFKISTLHPCMKVLFEKYYPDLMYDEEEVKEQEPQEKMDMTFMENLYARIDGIVDQLYTIYEMVDDRISETNS